jgi:hypothetical protein
MDAATAVPSTRRRPVMPAASVILLFAAFLGQLHQQVAVARSLPLLSVAENSPPASKDCIAALVAQLREAAASPVTAASSTIEDGLVSFILQKYVDCVASAARGRSHLGASDEDEISSATAGDDGSEESRKRKQLELVINETMAAFGATAPDVYESAVAPQHQSSAGIDELRVAAAAARGTGKDADQTVPESDVAGGRRPSLCTTLECLARLASTTFGPCMRVAESQCSALIAVLEAALQLRQQQQQQHHLSPVTDVDSKYQVEDLPASDGLLATTSAVEDTDKVSKEDEKEEQLKLLRRAIFARLRDLIAEYQLWRSERVTERRRSKRSVPISASDESGNGANVRDQSAPSLTSRSRRAINLASIPFKLPDKITPKLPDKITPETQAILEAYLAWREKNGYGKISGRWG